METEKKPNTELEQIADKKIIFDRNNIENVGGPIELETVKKWTQNYRKMNDKDTRSHLFGRKVIEKLLAQKDCAGIRIHYCIDDRGKKQLVLSGVGHNGQDQLPHEKIRLEVDAAAHALRFESQGYELVDQSWPCPETEGCPASV